MTSKKTPAESSTPSPSVDITALATALAEAIRSSESKSAETLAAIAQQFQANAPTKIRKYPEVWAEEQRKELEAKGRLNGEFYLHGRLMNPRHLDRNEVALLNQLEPGLYLEKKVSVTRKGTADALETWIHFSCKTSDQRNDIQRLAGAPGIRAILAKIVEEQVARKAALQTALDSGKAEDVLRHLAAELSQK